MSPPELEGLIRGELTACMLVADAPVAEIDAQWNRSAEAIFEAFLAAGWEPPVPLPDARTVLAGSLLVKAVTERLRP